MNKKIAALLLNAGFCGSIALTPIASAYAAESYKAPIVSEETVLVNELNDILPATMAEFTQFKEKYGTVSVHGKYIVYCDAVNYSVGNEVVMEQMGTAEIQKIKQYDIASDEPMPPGSESHTVIVYEAVSEGTVKLSWSQGCPWQWEESKTEISLNYFTVNEDLSVNEISEEEYKTISAETGFSYEVKDGSIVFENISKNSSMMSFIISSNSDYDMVCERDKSTFSPKEDGRYVLTVVQQYEEIFPVGMENSGHIHYFYPVVTSYTVDASGKEINIDKKNCHNYYSEEQITTIRESLADHEYVVCSDAEAEGSENLLNGTYFSFVNGYMPDTSYITNYYYSKYTVESYFCINIPGANGNSWVKVSDDTLVSTMEKMNTSSSMFADDIMDFYMVKALKDGEVTINAGYQLMIDSVIDKPGYDHDLVIENPGYDLVIENGIFKRADKKVSAVKGDANGDGEFNISDVVMLQKWLLSVPDTHLANWKAADFDEDGKLDVFDLCLMKRELIGQGQKEQKELYLATVTTRYSGHAVDGRDLGSGEFTEKFAVSKGDEFYETLDGHWIQDKTDFEPTVLKINDIDQNSVSLTFFHEGERKETVIPFGGNLNVDSNFVICDGINYTYNISFSENDDVASKYYITPIGYSDNLLELAHSDNSSAVITSTEELKSYLTPITVYENTDGLLERYNDSFFEDNILLLNALYLSNTAEIYSIDSVVYKGDKLVVNYKLTVDGSGGCVVNGALGVSEIPKRNYHADNVEWKLTSYFMGLKMDYIAVFNSEESNNIIHRTYIYKIDNGAGNYGFDYINTSINTKNWNERIWEQGSVMWTDDVFPIAKANKAYDYVTIPGDETKYTIDEFMARFLMD